jgi:hypothetical protein
MTTANTAKTPDGIPPKGSGIGALGPDNPLGSFNDLPNISILAI